MILGGIPYYLNLLKGSIPFSAKLSDNSLLTKMLKNLVDSGFVREYPLYGNKKRQTKYQLADFFTMFYLKFVKDNAGKDENYWANALDNPARKVWAGFTFEQLCKDHIRQIKRKIGISGVLSEVPTWYVQAENFQPGYIGRFVC